MNGEARIVVLTRQCARCAPGLWEEPLIAVRPWRKFAGTSEAVARPDAPKFPRNISVAVMEM